MYCRIHTISHNYIEEIQDNVFVYKNKPGGDFVSCLKNLPQRDNSSNIFAKYLCLSACVLTY